jgi:hypothetical protein
MQKQAEVQKSVRFADAQPELSKTNSAFAKMQ